MRLALPSSLLFPTFAIAFAAACSSETTTTTAPPPAATTTNEAPAEEPAAPAEEVVPADVAPFTEAEVQAIFDARCVKCHDSDNALLDLSKPFTRETIGVATNAGQKRGFCANSEYVTRIVPGDRNASLLFHKVKGTQDCGSRMPYDKGNPKLTATEVERLGRYIDGLTPTP